MELLRWKTRIALLWIIMVVNFSAYLFLSLVLGPGAIKELLETQVNEGTKLYVAILYFIPFIMAYLSLTLKDSANRWTNLVLGILSAIMFVSNLIVGLTGEVAPTILILYLFALVVSLLIIWYAWKWPKQAA